MGGARGVGLVQGVGLDMDNLAQADTVLRGDLLVDHHLVVCLWVEHPPRQHHRLVDAGKPPVAAGGEQEPALLPLNGAEEQVPHRQLRHFGSGRQPGPLRVDIVDLAREDDRVRRMGDAVEPG